MFPQSSKLAGFGLRAPLAKEDVKLLKQVKVASWVGISVV